MRARYYEPATGRFISEDPARDGMNWYLYADGNPVRKVDMEGKQDEEAAWIAMGYVFAAGAVIFGALTVHAVREFNGPEVGLALFPAILSGIAAVISVYAFFRGLGGLQAEWEIMVSFFGGTLVASAVFKAFEDTLEGLSRLGQAFGGFGLAAASAGAGYAAGVSAALLLSYVVD